MLDIHVHLSQRPLCRAAFGLPFARPALNEALKALDTLSGKEIAEVKAWQKIMAAARCSENGYY